MKIAITGGSGFVGTTLANAFVRAGHEVLVLDMLPPRRTVAGVQFIRTDLVSNLPVDDYLSCDAVIHLAGANIFARWTPAYKQKIISSRIETARALIEAVRVHGRGPSVFVTASAVGYYGDGGEGELTESSPNGTDFLAGVCQAWERAAAESESVGMRFVAVRTGIVLGPGGGMLAKLIPAFRLGLGGRMGTGRQWFSWISIDDLVSVYLFSVLDGRVKGALNAVSPAPVRNRDLAKALGAVLHRPVILPLPGFVLRLLLGELGGVVLSSQRVLPAKLLSLGFVFRHTDIHETLRTTSK